MSVKKIALMTAASVAVLTAGVSFAGGSYTAPVASNSGVYVDVAAGAFLRDVKDNSSLTAPSNVTYDNGQSGFTVGGDLGYQFNKTWAVEVGYNWIQDQKVDVTSAAAVAFVGAASQTFAAADYVKVKSWLLDAALKGSLPVMDSVSAFAKIGVAYTHNEVDFYDATTHYKKDTNYWNPKFAVGLDYNIAQSWTVGVEYSYVPGGDDWSKVAADDITLATTAGTHHFPGVHGLNVTAGYTFAI